MAVNLANMFGKKDVPHLLIVSRKTGALESQVSDLSNVRFLGKRKTFDLDAFKKLLAQLDRFDADILHAHGPSVYWGVAVKLFRPSIQLLWHDHLGISTEVVVGNPRKEIKWISRWIDCVITANESTRDFWMEKGFWPKDKVEFLPNFPSLTAFPSQKPPIFTFLHLANFRSEKGHLHLIQAGKKLVEKGLEFRIRMVGKDVDPQWKKSISESVQTEGLSQKISLESECGNVSQLLAQVDAGLVVSDREGLPVALLEYGLCALPVISSDVGQCSVVLEGGKFGLIFPPADVDSLASAMEKMLSNPPEYVEMGKSYQKHVLENYGEDQFFAGYKDLLQLY